MQSLISGITELVVGYGDVMYYTASGNMAQEGCAGGGDTGRLLLR